MISYKLLGTNEFFVVHHTDCGMELFTDDIIAGLLAQSLETATIDSNGWRDVGKKIAGNTTGKYLKWHTIDNLAGSVVEDVQRIRSHPLVPGNIPVYGYIYDVKTGRLNEVEAATAAGRPTIA